LSELAYDSEVAGSGQHSNELLHSINSELLCQLSNYQLLLKECIPWRCLGTVIF